MAFIIGEDRYQVTLLPNTLDEYVSEDNPVRVIDAYVDSLDLEEIGFKVYSGQNPGQKPYRREDLLKIYIYCYMNKIRSSRNIEVELTRNVELMWLVGKIKPDHGTISSFMKYNKEAIKQLFREFTLMLKGFGLIDGSLIAIDGTKIKANNAKNKHYNENIIKEKMAYYDSKIESYINDFLSVQEDESQKQKITEKIEKYKDRIKQLKIIKNEISAQKKKQVCLTDPDSKSMKNNGKFEVCYNMQTAVDGKNKLIINYDVVNDVNDQSQLSNMVNKSRQIFKENEIITVVADTGYFNMSEIINVVSKNIRLLIKGQKSKQDKLESGFDKSSFIYNKSKDIYTCPMGYTLEFKWCGKQNGNVYKRYTCINYMNCGKKDICTTAKEGRSVTRIVGEEIIEMVEQRTIEMNDVYKKRGSIVEHPFGSIKRHLGYTHFLTRGLDSVNTEASLICLVYNIKRLIQIKGTKKLLEYFKQIISKKACFLAHVFH